MEATRHGFSFGVMPFLIPCICRTNESWLFLCLRVQALFVRSRTPCGSTSSSHNSCFSFAPFGFFYWGLFSPARCFKHLFPEGFQKSNCFFHGPMRPIFFPGASRKPTNTTGQRFQTCLSRGLPEKKMKNKSLLARCVPSFSRRLPYKKRRE